MMLLFLKFVDIFLLKKGVDAWKLIRRLHRCLGWPAFLIYLHRCVRTWRVLLTWLELAVAHSIVVLREPRVRGDCDVVRLLHNRILAELAIKFQIMHLAEKFFDVFEIMIGIVWLIAVLTSVQVFKKMLTRLICLVCNLVPLRNLLCCILDNIRSVVTASSCIGDIDFIEVAWLLN